MYKCYIDGTGNNIFITVSDEKGKLLVQLSAGILGMVGPGKGTPYAAEITGKKVSDKLVVNSIKNLTVFIGGKISKVVRGAIGGLLLGGVTINEIYFLNSVAHNGVGLPKMKRK